MRDILAEEGRLELTLGMGWLSRHECGALENGAVLVCEQVAGEPFRLEFEGCPLARAKMVVLEGNGQAYVCAAVEKGGCDSGIRRYPSLERGVDITELLPFKIVVAQAMASLGSLEGLGVKSLIDFGQDLDESMDASLFVAGSLIAKGKVCVVGERLGIRLGQVVARAAQAGQFRASGRLLRGAAALARSKDYDFRRPDCFTRTQLEGFDLVHRDFLEALSRLSGFDTSTWRLSVDQLNFTEFSESLSPAEAVLSAPCYHGGAGGCHGSEADASPWRDSQEDMAGGRGTAPVKALLRLGKAPDFPVAYAEEWTRRELARPRGGSILASGDLVKAEGDSICLALREAWRNYGGLAPKPGKLLTKPDQARPALAFADYAEEYEMIALASIDMGGGNFLNLAYPLRVMEPVLGALTP